MRFTIFLTAVLFPCLAWAADDLSQKNWGFQLGKEVIRPGKAAEGAIAVAEAKEALKTSPRIKPSDSPSGRIQGIASPSFRHKLQDTDDFRLWIDSGSAILDSQEVLACVSGETNRRRRTRKRIRSGSVMRPLAASDKCPGSSAGFAGKWDWKVPSIRLLQIRDGFEDREYMVLLQKWISLAKRHGPAERDDRLIQEAEQLLGIADRFIHDFTTVTDDAADMLAARAKVADMIERLRQSLTGTQH